MKKILITGAGGFIGSHVLDHVIASGYAGTGWGRYDDNNVRRVELENHEELTAALAEEKPDIIIHCAGSANVAGSFEDPKADFDSNVICTYNLLQAVKDAQICPVFLFLSSAAVYGNPSVLPVDENAQRNPLSPYALHKMMAEDICLFFAGHYGIPVKIARVFSAYGRGLKKQIFWDMNKKSDNTGKIGLFGCGNESRDFIHIDDVVKALLLIAVSETSDSVFNVANGEEITIRNAAEIFAAAKGLDPSVISFNGTVREGDPLFWKADISRLEKLGYRPGVKFSDGVNDYVSWLKESGRQEPVSARRY